MFVYDYRSSAAVPEQQVIPLTAFAHKTSKQINQSYITYSENDWPFQKYSTLTAGRKISKIIKFAAMRQTD